MNEQEYKLRIAELEKERDHWKANHDSAIARARVLVERPDMPLERVSAFRHMEKLQRLVNVQTMLLEAFNDKLQRPEGADPFKDESDNAFEASLKRLTDAYCVQQPLPVPDQMALVWRIDIGRLRAKWIHLNAFFEDRRGRETRVVQNDAAEVIAVTETDAEGQVKRVIWEKAA